MNLKAGARSAGGVVALDVFDVFDAFDVFGAFGVFGMVDPCD